MLNASYTIQKFSEKFQKITTIQEFQTLVKTKNIEFSVEIASSTVWLLDWSMTNSKFSGTIEISLSPKISDGTYTFATLGLGKTFRVESPDLSLINLEAKFLDALKSLMKNLRQV